MLAKREFRALLIGIALAASTTAGIAKNNDRAEADNKRIAAIGRMEQSVAIIDVTEREVRHKDSWVVVTEESAIASGVLVTADGVVITAAHAIVGATDVSVRFISGGPQHGEVIFVDDATDIALVRVAKVPPGIKPARLGNSDKVRKGETVYIIGSPLGIEFSLSMGIVSGRHPMKHVGGVGEIEMIQTDAAMNEGNSGGPMFNDQEEVIGIAQRILTRGGGSEGLGFGVAINEVRNVLGTDPCLWLGMSVVGIDEAWAAALNVPAKDVLLVQRVLPESPAAKAGLRGGDLPVQTGEAHLLLGGDVILKIDGSPVSEWRRAPWTDMTDGATHRVVISILRGGRNEDLVVEMIHRRAVVDELGPEGNPR